jgi:hypothetical protein
METLLISGPKRSGTHLLYRLLDGHPELFNALAETYFLEYVAEVDRTEIDLLLDFLIDEELEPVFDQIQERALLPLFDGDANLGEAYGPDQDMDVAIDQDELRATFDEARQSADRSVQGIWSAWFQSLQTVAAPDRTIRPCVFKCADYGPSARAAADLLSDRKILFILRNPVFTFSSLRKLRTKQAGSRQFTTLRLIEEIRNYRRFCETRAMLTAQSGLETHTVRFEDLVLDPKARMSEISEFFRVEFQDILTEPTFLGRSWMGDSSYDSYQGVSVEPLDPDRINLTSAERELVASGLETVLDSFNYDVYPSAPTELSKD